MSKEFKGNHNSPRRTRRREKDWLSGFIHGCLWFIPEIPPFRSAHTTAKRCRESQLIKGLLRSFQISLSWEIYLANKGKRFSPQRTRRARRKKVWII